MFVKHTLPLLLVAVAVCTEVRADGPTVVEAIGGTVQAYQQQDNLNVYTLTAVAHDGYFFTGWTDGCKKNDRLVDMATPAGSKTYQPAFQALTTIRDYTPFINHQAQRSGVFADYTVLQGGIVTYQYVGRNTTSTPGTDYNLHAIPAEGYHFVHWRDLDPTSDYYANPDRFITLNGAEAIRRMFPVFEQDDRVFTRDSARIVVDGGRICIIDSGKPHDSYFTLLAVANHNHYFAGWVDDQGKVISRHNPATFQQQQAATAIGDVITYRALFVRNTRFHIDLVNQTHTDYGIITTPTANSCGTTYELTAVVDTINEFGGWKDAPGTDLTRTYVVPQDRDTVTLIPTYHREWRKYEHASSMTDGGIIAPPDGWQFTCCEPVYQLEAKPNHNWYFAGWSDGSSKNPRTVRPRTDTRTLRAYFIHNNRFHADTVSYAANGGQPHFAQADLCAPDILLTATPVPDFSIHHWTVDGGEELRQEAVQMTVPNNQDTVRCTVAFMPTLFPHDFIHTDCDYGQIVLDSLNLCSSYYVVRAQPTDEAHFAGWVDAEGTVRSMRNPRYFTLRDVDTALTAKFMPRKAEYTMLLSGTQDGNRAFWQQDPDCPFRYTLTSNESDYLYFQGWEDQLDEQVAAGHLHADTPRVVILNGQDTSFAAVYHPRTALDVDSADSHIIRTVGGQITLAEDVNCATLSTMTAVAEDGYYFAGWGDGLKRNHRLLNLKDIALGEDSLVTATFLLSPYWPDTRCLNSDAGSITFERDADCPLTYTLGSTAEYGYNVHDWINPVTHDTLVRNTLTTTLRPDTVIYIARFTPILYPHDLTVIGNGGGAVEYDNVDLCTSFFSIRALPDAAHYFAGWSDGLNRNPRYFTLREQDTTVTALFRPRAADYHIVRPTIPGGVNTHWQVDPDCDSRYTMTATESDFAYFGHWDDLSADTPRVVTLNGRDTVFTAYFIPRTVLDVDSTRIHSEGGSIVTHETFCGAQNTMYAVPQGGFNFAGWSDGLKRNPRTLDLTDIANHSDSAVTAVFARTLTVEAKNNPNGGSVRFNGTDSITAYPAPGYMLRYWTDHLGNHDQRRPVTGLETIVDYDDTVRFVAQFDTERKLFDVTTTGQVDWEEYGDVCERYYRLYARNAGNGYVFHSWDDGSTDNPRLIYPDRPTTYIAKFEWEGCRTLADYLDNACGGRVRYTQDPVSECACDYLLTATPPTGYTFIGWADSHADNPRLVSLDKVENHYIALFMTQDRHFMEWFDGSVLIRTQSMNLTDSLAKPGYTMTALLNGDTLSTGTLTHDGKGTFRLAIDSLRANSSVGSSLQIHFRDGTNTLFSAIPVSVPLVVTQSQPLSHFADQMPDNMSNTAIVVRDGATLTQDTAQMAIGDLEIIGNAKYVLPHGDTLNVRSVRMGSNGMEQQYPQLVARGSLINRNADTIYYDYKLNQQLYYPLATPYPVVCADMRLWTGATPSFQSYYYDGLARVNAGSGWTAYDDTQAGAGYLPGQGYTIYAARPKWNGIRQDTAILRMPFVADLTEGENTNKTIEVFAFGDETVTDNNRNWNFIGNPYLSDLHGDFDTGTGDGYANIHIGQLVENLSATGAWTGAYHWDDELRYVTIPKNGFTEYEQIRVEEATMRSFNSYFVQSSGNGYLTFDVSALAQAPKRGTVHPSEFKADIVLTGAAGHDRTGLLFGDAFTTGYDYNADYSKWLGGSEAMSLYSIMPVDNTDGRFAFLAMPTEQADQLIPLGYKTTTTGRMTFSVRDDAQMLLFFDQLNLIDKQTGTVTDLLLQDYTFTAIRTADDDRFVLNARLNREMTQPTDLSTQDGNKAGAHLQPGIYDILGRTISRDNKAAACLPPGVYVIVTPTEIRKEVIR